MLASQQTSKQASKQTTPPESTQSSSASSPAEVEPSGSDVPPVSKKGKPSPVMVTMDPSINLLDMHPVKAFPSVWDLSLAPKNMGVGLSWFYICSVPNCNFQVTKIGPVWSHVASIHTNKEAVYLLCEVVFVSPYSMQEHIYLHFPECKKGGQKFY